MHKADGELLGRDARERPDGNTEPGMTSTGRIAFFLMLVALPGCTADAYLKVASAYGKAASESLEVLSAAPSVSASLCHARAQLDFIYKRVDTTKLGEQSLNWATFEDMAKLPLPNSTGTATVSTSASSQTWATHCKNIATADEVIVKAMSALAAYAKALDKVAETEFPGSDIESLVTNVSALTGQLGAGDATTASVKSLAGPVKELGLVILRSYTAKQTKAIVANAHDHVVAIIDGVRKYLDAIDSERKDAEAELKNTAQKLDARLAPPESPASSPSDLLVLSDWATRRRQDLVNTQTAIDSAKEALSSLQKAHGKLKEANGDKNAPELKTALGELNTVLANIRCAAGPHGQHLGESP